MKRLYHILLIVLIAFCTHCKNHDELNILDKEGLNLYWHHVADVDRGRYLLMSFTNSHRSTNRAEYKFEYNIQGQVIDVRLVEKIDKGKCPVYPMPQGDECQSRGDIYIRENELSKGTYQFRLQTGDNVVTSDLIVGQNQYELKVPVNPYFTNSIPFVYAIPKNIVYGSIRYYGKENELFAKALIDDLTKTGLKPATVPLHPYRHLPENSQTHLAKSFWEPDGYSINLLFSWDGSFKQVSEICKKHFEQSKKQLGIGLYNSNFMEQVTGEQYGTFSAYLR
ncbi:hypothetical protein [Dyadobacter sp. 676]|uniref:DUF4249 domain-containing protein n=1 Tax=Dyadobacter sp. 676 TaxID=3088362 RepID=A0AAU8FIY2_9BACT